MKIESRGVPPYLISSGLELPLDDLNYRGHEQFRKNNSFEDAFYVLCELMDFGDYIHGEYIIDNTQTIILTVCNPSDVCLLKNAGKAIESEEIVIFT